MLGLLKYYLTKRLLEEYRDSKIIGFDSVNDYYDVALKEWRLKQLENYEKFTFIRG